jgi:hypothetical protein
VSRASGPCLHGMLRAHDGSLSRCVVARYTSAAFDAWKGETLRTKELLQRTLRHMTNRTVSLVWVRWREMVLEQREQRAAAGRAIGRWKARFVAQTFQVRSCRGEPSVGQLPADDGSSSRYGIFKCARRSGRRRCEKPSTTATASKRKLQLCGLIRPSLDSFTCGRRARRRTAEHSSFSVGFWLGCRMASFST